MKTMCRRGLLALLAALILTLSGCTGAQGQLSRGESVSAKLGDYRVAVVGVEKISDTRGQPAMRVYYDFTNESDEPVSASEIDVSARQLGLRLGDAYTFYEDDAAEYGNNWLAVYPGVTIRCVEEFHYIPWVGSVVITLEDWWTGESMKVSVNAAALPGAPAESFSIAPIAQPDYTDGWADEGACMDGYFRLLDYEVVPAERYSDFDRVLRVRFAYTNRASFPDSAAGNVYITAYQDGVQLQTAYAALAIDEEDRYYEDIGSDETAECAVSFGLRTDSPVELVLDENARIGLRADIAE